MSNKNLVINHNAGFFSCCTIRLRSIINYYNEHGFLPTVDSSSQWQSYKDENVDITEKFFKDNNYNFQLPKFKFSESKEEDQFSDYKLINFKFVNHFIKKYFSLSDEILSFKNLISNKYSIDLQKTLSIYYRGNDKILETIVPEYDEYLETINYRIKKNNIKNILVQSDEIEFYDFILERFENVIIIDEIFKSKKGLYNDSNQVPHGFKTKNAQILLAIISLISESEQVITNSGNIGMWISLFRGGTHNFSQYLNPREYIYGVKNENYEKREQKWIHN